jgi:hypothetical protein
MYYYAIFDLSVEPENPSFGFCDTKKVLAFSRRQDLDAALKYRRAFDLSARRISRKEAMKHLDRLYTGDRGLLLDRVDGTVHAVSGEDRYLIYRPVDRMYKIVRA